MVYRLTSPQAARWASKTFGFLHVSWHESLRYSRRLESTKANRIPHYRKVHQLADAVEQAVDAQDYAHQQATFNHWMLNQGSIESLI